MAPAKCSWFSLDINANPDLTYGAGELHPGSPMIKLNRTEAGQYNKPSLEASTGMPANLPNSLSLDAFEAYFANAASTYASGPRTCGSTRVLGSFIGDPREIHLRLLSKLRTFVHELYHIRILHGMTQEQPTLLLESYNLRFDHLERSIAPDTLAPAAPAALWYDHFINIALANIVQEPLDYKHTATGLPPL